jgi:hypothetical protein
MRKSTTAARAIIILPQGIVFLDPEAATFSGTRNMPRSTIAAPTCSSRARGWDTIRIGVERGDYPEAIGREEEWIRRLTRSISPAPRADAATAAASDRGG